MFFSEFLVGKMKFHHCWLPGKMLLGINFLPPAKNSFRSPWP